MASIAGVYADAGFPGCIGAVDGTKLVWNNCPFYLKGQYHISKDRKMATVVVKEWCGHELYVRSCFEWRCETNNGKTMLCFCPLFTDILSGALKKFIPVLYSFFSAGKTRRMAEFIGYGIYPDWSMFVRPINKTPSGPRKAYSKLQEGLQKDNEGLFEVLRGRFRILWRESELWIVEQFVLVSEVCVILHIIIIRMRLTGALDDDVEKKGSFFI